jgi:hypothetical protein
MMIFFSDAVVWTAVKAIFILSIKLLPLFDSRRLQVQFIHHFAEEVAAGA